MTRLLDLDQRSGHSLPTTRENAAARDQRLGQGGGEDVTGLVMVA